MEYLAGKKIGLLGGSFDPIHNGHLTIAKAAYHDFHLDEVWFIPAGHSPNKDENVMTCASYRAKMTKLAIAPYPYFKLCTIEIDSSQTSFTYLTLTKLKNRYPDTQFFFIMGADSLDYFETWKHPNIICQNANLLVAVRDGWDERAVTEKIHFIKNNFHAKIYLLSCPKFDAASREIRQLLFQGNADDTNLPENVTAFIMEHHLYGC